MYVDTQQWGAFVAQLVALAVSACVCVRAEHVG